MDTETSPPRADAWRLARYLFGAPFTDIAALTHPVAKGAAVAMERANGEGRDGAWRTYLLTLGREVATAWQAAVFAEDPDSDEPGAEADTPRYTLHQAAEAYAPLPPVPWVVEPVLARGRVHCFYGDGGSKKTFTGYDLAVAVALGADDWLGFALHGGRVLVTDEEAGAADVRRRLALAMRDRGAPAALPLVFTTKEDFDFRDPDDRAAIEALLATEHPALWFIDALQDVTPGADENATRDMAPPLRWLKTMATRHNICIVIVHHSGRDGKRYRGASAIKQQVDMMLLIESAPDSPNIDFVSEKVRDGPPLHFGAAVTFYDDKVHFHRTGEAKPRARLTGSERHVVDYLAVLGQATVADIENSVDPDLLSPRTATNALKKLVERKLVRRSDDGGPGTKATYELATPPTLEVPW
jgi:hypothetical protein